MKTNDLIVLLAQDATIKSSLTQVLAHAVVAAVLIAGIFFFAAIGVRPDIDVAMQTYRFVFKFFVTIALAVSASLVLFRIGRPGALLRSWSLGLFAPLLLILAAVILELLVMPETTWAARMVGHNARFCLTLIPAVSVGPLACFLYAMRSGAPERPGVAGAVAGLAAAGIAATFYAANCDDDSPLFVLLWYPIAISIVTAIGWLIGRRVLRW